MFGAAAFSDAGDRPLKGLFAQAAHLAEDLLEFAVVSDCLLEQWGLFLGEGQADGLGFNLARQAPSPRWLRHEAALGDPSQVQQGCFELLVALFQPPQSRGRQSRFGRAI